MLADYRCVPELEVCGPSWWIALERIFQTTVAGMLIAFFVLAVAMGAVCAWFLLAGSLKEFLHHPGWRVPSWRRRRK